MPYLKSVNAPDRNVYPLTQDTVVLGRSKETDLVISGDSVSKRHAQIQFDGQGYILTDLGSKNGTFLNNQDLQQQARLSPGDHIRIGDTILVFMDEVTEPASIVIGRDDPQAQASMFRADQLPYTVLGDDPRSRTPDAENHLVQLTQLSKDVMALDNEQALSEMVIHRMLEWLSVDCCAIVYPQTADDGYDLDIQAIALKKPDASREMSISETAVRQALENKMASITTNALQDDRFMDQQSVITRGLVSILCVPLWHEDQIFGLLYLDSSDMSVQLTVDHLGLVSAVANLTAIKIDNLRLVDDAIAKSAMDKELALAGEIQARLLPGDAFTFHELACVGFHQACEDIGGDYYDFIPYDDHILSVTIADVTGHGPSSALLMVACKTMLTTLVEIKIPLEERIERLNEYMVNHSSSNQFITFFHADIDIRAQTLRYCNAGHNPPMLLSPGGRVTHLPSVGPPIGIMVLPYEIESIAFKPGDKLIMYTDGITEAASPDGALYGEPGLEALIAQRADQEAGILKNSIIDAITTFTAGIRHLDDVTLSIVEYTD